MTDLSPLFLSLNSTIADTIRCIDSNMLGIVLVVDEHHHLLGTVVDGDIRRAILAQMDVQSPISLILEQKPEMYRQPITAHVKTNRQKLIEMMRERYVRHVPLLNDAGQVVDIFQFRDLLETERSAQPLQAVVMAGGFGTRLRPLTEGLPKPMLPVGGRPLLEHVIRQLRKAGIRHINVTTHYMPEKIEDYFGDGSAFDVDINYVNEAQPLGTAGGITLLEAPDTPLLVMNGDLLTDVNFEEMYNYHREQNAMLTVAVRKYEVNVPYGVVEGDGGFVQRLVEKPSYRFFVNAGIYLLEPKAVQMLPKGKQVHMTDLIDSLIVVGHSVASFPLREYWLDIGQPTDYEQAQEDVKDGEGQIVTLDGKRVLVTGAGGFIGSHLAEALVTAGAHVRALVHYNALGSRGWLDQSSASGQMEVVAGDIVDFDSVKGAMQGVEVVFHLAALIAIPYSYVAPGSYVRTNIQGTLNILQAARDLGAERLVHTSTSEVYGTARYVPIDENHPLQGQSPYSASKIGADKLAESFHLSFGVPVVTVRPFNTFGPRQSMRAVIPTIITQCLRGDTVKLGSIHPTRDLNYVADTVNGFMCAAESDAVVGETVNIGSGQEISIGNLVQMIAGLVGHEIHIETEEQRVRPEKSEVDRLLAANAKAQTLLKWKPQITLEDGLALTIEWIEKHQERYRSNVYTI